MGSDSLCKFRDDLVHMCKYLAKQWALAGVGKADDYETQRSTLINEYGVDVDAWSDTAHRTKSKGMNTIQGLADGNFHTGIAVVASYVSDKVGAARMNVGLMNNDDKYSLYAFMRAITGDKSINKDSFMKDVESEYGIKSDLLEADDDGLDKYRDNVVGACRYLVMQRLLMDYGEPDSYERQRSKLINDYNVNIDEWIDVANRRGGIDVGEGLVKGDLAAGMSVVANYMLSKANAPRMRAAFMKDDTEHSLYAFMRNVTGDQSITKDTLSKEARHENALRLAARHPEFKSPHFDALRAELKEIEARKSERIESEYDEFE